MNKLDILRGLVRNYMLVCDGYNAEYCEPTLCPECNLCDGNISVECHKVSNICIKCGGTGLASYTCLDVSTTRLCNQCGGTGNFYNSSQ